MKWPWMKAQHERHRPAPDEAKRDLEQIRSRRPDVDRLVNQLRIERERNHFGESVQQIFGGTRP